MWGWQLAGRALLGAQLLSGEAAMSAKALLENLSKGGYYVQHAWGALGAFIHLLFSPETQEPFSCHDLPLQRGHSYPASLPSAMHHFSFSSLCIMYSPLQPFEASLEVHIPWTTAGLYIYSALAENMHSLYPNIFSQNPGAWHSPYRPLSIESLQNLGLSSTPTPTELP